MTPNLVRYYHRLPYPLRVVAATGRGLRLRRWRYGAETERLVEEAVERETWSPAQWVAWRENALVSLLDRAARTVPFYREQWARRRRAGDRASWEDLANWPPLPKSAPRRHPRAFLANERQPRKLFELHTSGSTGSPLTVWVSRTDLRRWYALYEARIRQWNEVSIRDRWCILGGQLVTPFEQEEPPYWVWNHAMHQLYLSSYHVSPTTVAAYARAIREHRAEYLLGYPSSMSALAASAFERGVELPSMRVVIGNAEPMFAWQREILSRAFGAPVRHTYGMTEMVAGASECAGSTMHQWPEAGLVEYFDVDHSGLGRIMCTGLINTSMPLIRYEVGDSGRPADEMTPCGCGRTLPRMGHIEGRSDDVIITPDGRRIGRLDPVFKADMPIREAQIVQETPEALRVFVVPAPGYSRTTERMLRERLAERVGEMNIAVELVESIPRSANGKFKAVVSKLAHGA